MNSDTLIQMALAHAEGEVGNVITGGVAPPTGATLWEQRDWQARDLSQHGIRVVTIAPGLFLTPLP